MIQVTLREYLYRLKGMGKEVPTLAELAKQCQVNYSTLFRTVSNRYGARVNLVMLSEIIYYLRTTYGFDTQLTDILTFDERKRGQIG